MRNTTRNWKKSVKSKSKSMKELLDRVINEQTQEVHESEKLIGLIS